MSCKLLFSCGVTESLMSLLRQRKGRKLVPILPSQPAHLHRYRSPPPPQLLAYFLIFWIFDQNFIVDFYCLLKNNESLNRDAWKGINSTQYGENVQNMLDIFYSYFLCLQTNLWKSIKINNQSDLCLCQDFLLLKLEILCQHTSQIVHCFSFSSTNIEALIENKDIFQICISVEFRYSLWLLI